MWTWTVSTAYGAVPPPSLIVFFKFALKLVFATCPGVSKASKIKSEKRSGWLAVMAACFIYNAWAIPFRWISKQGRQQNTFNQTCFRGNQCQKYLKAINLNQVFLPGIPIWRKHLEVVLCRLSLRRSLSCRHCDLQAPHHLHGKGFLGEGQEEADTELYPGRKL